MRMREVVFSEILARMSDDDSIAVLTGDLGYGLLEPIRDAFPERFINMGICEQNMISTAAGLALDGWKVYCYSIGNFPTFRCLEQIRNDVCYHECDVKIVCVGSGLSYGSLGTTHHATEDIAIMRVLPNMDVFCPADPEEARKVTLNSLETSGPAYIRLNKKGEPVLNIHCDLPYSDIGVTWRRRENGGIAIFSTGAISMEAQKAADALHEMGMPVSFVTFPRIKPLNENVIIEVAQSSKCIVTIEEHNLSGGFGSAIAEALIDLNASIKLSRMGIPNVFASCAGSQLYFRNIFDLNADSIVARCRQVFEETR